MGLFYDIASYVQRLAGGAKPSDMPIEQSPRFYMAVNLKTAALLGVAKAGGLMSYGANIADQLDAALLLTAPPAPPAPAARALAEGSGHARNSMEKGMARRRLPCARRFEHASALAESVARHVHTPPQPCPRARP